MRTDIVEVFKFDELSDEAKEKAREWYRCADDGYEWWEAVYDDAKQVGALMGFDVNNIYFSGFSSQGDGACFEGSFRYAKGCAKAIKDYGLVGTELQKIAKEWQSIQARNFYSVTGSVRHSGHYHHSGCTSFDIERNGQWASDDLEEDVKDCVRSFMDWIYNQLEKEYDWLNSDDQVDESLRANEYEFTADGSIY